METGQDYLDAFHRSLERRKDPETRWVDRFSYGVTILGCRTRVRLVTINDELRAVGVCRLEYRAGDGDVRVYWHDTNYNEPMETYRPWYLNDRLTQEAVRNVLDMHTVEIYSRD